MFGSVSLPGTYRSPNRSWLQTKGRIKFQDSGTAIPIGVLLRTQDTELSKHSHERERGGGTLRRNSRWEQWGSVQGRGAQGGGFRNATRVTRAPLQPFNLSF